MKPGKKRIITSVIILLALIFIGSYSYFRGNINNKNRFFQIWYYKIRFLIPLKKEPNVTLIATAIRRRDYESLEALLKLDNSIFDSKFKFHESEYMSALKYSDEKTILMLLAAGVKPDSLMSQIIKENKRDMVNLLVDCGADVNCQSEYKNTPLHIAARFGRKEIVSELISCGANVNKKDGALRTPLHYAVEQGKTPIFLDTLDYIHRTPSCKVGDYLEITKILMKNGADINAKDFWGQTPLHCAASMGPFDGYISYGVFSNGTDNSIPLNCIVDENMDITRLLIENGADIHSKDNKGLTPIINAVKSGNRQAANYILSKGTKITNTIIETYGPFGPQTSLLSLSSAGGLYKITKKILRNDNSVKDIDPETGYTPLHYASTGFFPLSDFSNDFVGLKQRKLKIAQLLIARGYDVNAVTRYKETTLHIAVESKFPEMAEFLISKDADVKAKDDKDRTPLDLTKDKDMIKTLQKHGAKSGKDIENAEK